MYLFYKILIYIDFKKFTNTTALLFYTKIDLYITCFLSMIGFFKLLLQILHIKLDYHYY